MSNFLYSQMFEVRNNRLKKKKKKTALIKVNTLNSFSRYCERKRKTN